jgi:AI-2 transport protein TqsA
VDTDRTGDGVVPIGTAPEPPGERDVAAVTLTPGRDRDGTAIRAIAPPDGPSPGLPRLVAVLLGLAAAVIALAGVRELSDLVGPGFLALVLVLTLDPVRAVLHRRGAPDWAGVAALLVATYAILLALIAALVYSVVRLGLLLPDYAPRLRDLVAQLLAVLEPLGVSQANITDLLRGIDLSSYLSGVRPILSGAGSAASALLVVILLVLFLGIDAPGIARRLPAARIRPDLAGALETFVVHTRRYVVVSSGFGLIVAIVDVALLSVVGVPLPLVWGLLSFVTNYVPNVGFVLGVAPPALLAYLDGGTGPLVAVIVGYSVANFVIQSIIQPKVVGDAVGLSATITVLSLLFWAAVLGPLGGLLAVPLTLFVKAVFVDADPGARWLRALLGDAEAEAEVDAGRAEAAATRVEPRSGS